MGPLSKYWEILRLDPGDKGCGYRRQSLPLASEFFRTEFSELMESRDLPEQSSRSRSDTSVLVPVRSHLSVQQHRAVQAMLHREFTAQSSCTDLRHRAQAGLCLRGYISYTIVAACKILASKFSATGQLTYRDLLPYVLDDDGEMQVILDQNAKNQLVLNSRGEFEQYTYKLFSVEVLRKFNPNAPSATSLDNWVHLQTRQNQDLKNVLSERGFYKLSDWALLNRARQPQLDKLSSRERHMVETFHRVYRRDRRQQQHNHLRCPNPSPAQLYEMQQHLQTKNILFDSPARLLAELRQIAQLLRQYAIWSSNGMPQSESLADPYSGMQREFDDPNSVNNLDQIARQEIRELCCQQLLECLDWAINKGICEHVHSLHQRRRYAVFAPKVKEILELVYCQRQSQSKIADTLGMTNQSQVSRVLNPTTLLKRIRYWTVDHFLKMLLTRIDTLATVSTDPDYLNNLMESIEAFVDAEAFQPAVAEIKTAKNRSMNSLYAQRLRHYLER